MYCSAKCKQIAYRERKQNTLKEVPNERPAYYENNTGKIRILWFSTANCSACVDQEKELKKFEKRKTFREMYVLEKVDPYNRVDMAKDFALKVLPTLVFIKADGGIYDVCECVVSDRDLKAIMEKINFTGL